MVGATVSEPIPSLERQWARVLPMEEVMSTDAMAVTRRLLGGIAAAAFAWPAMAQEVLPPPEPPFKGVIGETYKDSTPDKIPLIKAPDGAPNVLVVLIDDSGFGQWSTFGGLIATPNLDRFAANGLRYTRFHTTALCSP